MGVDRVSVPSRTSVDISDGTQWRGTELTSGLGRVQVLVLGTCT